MPLISIVVPAYNAADTLAETLDAILAQTARDWECVVVDDGSKDTTLELARSYEQQDARIRVLTQANRGTGGAYNTGVREATGSWVSICSADDVLLPPHVESMARAISRYPGFQIYSCNGYYWHADDSRVQVYTGEAAAAYHEWTLEETLARCFFSVGACYERGLFDAVGGYVEDAYGEDYDFWLRTMAQGARQLYVPEALSLHRISATQKSANLAKAFESDVRSIQNALDTGNLTPSQAKAARSAIGLRRRMIHEERHPYGLYALAHRLGQPLLSWIRRR